MCDSNFHDSINAYEKGLPAKAKKSQQYDLRKGEVSLPCATLIQDAIKHNVKWMQDFANQCGVLLAPHGKTSLTPEILKMQVDAGAWGIAVANIQQALVAKNAGAKHVLIANQLVGEANFELASKLMEDIELYVCVDSIPNVRALNSFFESHSRSLNVLLEIGVTGGRSGVRHKKDVHQLVAEIQSSDNLSFQGLEFYEGVIHGENEEEAIRQFIDNTCDIFIQLCSMSVFDTNNPIITGAGSAWYDLVIEAFQNITINSRKIIRPGCYVSHDKGIYQVAQDNVLKRIEKSNSFNVNIQSDLKSAIEVWAYAQSCPEKNLIIVNLGKRDVAFDTDLPSLERVYRNGQQIDVEVSSIKTIDIMDQHLFLKVNDDCQIDVGDTLVFSTSHPCITFDKWRFIAICENNIATHWVKPAF